MKVSEKLPPVLMREYRDQAELMAVFTRPATRSQLGLADFAFVQDDAQVLGEMRVRDDEVHGDSVRVAYQWISGGAGERGERRAAASGARRAALTNPGRPPVVPLKNPCSGAETFTAGPRCGTQDFSRTGRNTAHARLHASGTPRVRDIAVTGPVACPRVRDVLRGDRPHERPAEPAPRGRLTDYR